MEAQEKIMDHLELIFRDHESRLNGSKGSVLHNLHQKSFDLLKQVQFPDRKHEDWKYTAVQRLISPEYKLATEVKQVNVPDIAGLDTYIIPVLNGKVIQENISPDLKQSGIIILSLHEILQDATLGQDILKWISPDQPTANNAFELLNLSFQYGGFFMDVPKNLSLDKPIEIRYLHDSKDISFSHPSYFIRVGSGSALTVVERFERNTETAVPTSKGFINLSGYISLDKNASLTQIRWQDLPETQSLVYKLAVTQERDSRYDAFGFDFGGDLIRNTINIDLNESNTFTSLQAGYIAKKKQSIDHQTSIHHKVPHCESHECFKGIIDDQASAAFNGKVFVYPDAQKTNAYQQNDTLVLSPFAVMNSKPQLEIFADDVKCSHGATIGQLDEKALFYLKARGIDQSTAQHMLKAAFLAQVLDVMPNIPLRDYIRSRMSLDI